MRLTDGALKDILAALKYLATILFPRADEVKDNPVINPPEHVVVPPPEAPKYLWDTTANSRHSVRVLCDEMGLTLAEKNIITAVIQAESNFNNNAKCYNKNTAGKITSTDHGVCQINDFYHVGIGKKFPSVKYIMENPDKCVIWMIQMFKQGKIDMWIAHKNGSYKRYL